MRQCTVPLNTNLSSFPNLSANVMMLESTLLIFCGMGTNIVVLLSMPTHCSTTQFSSKSNLKFKNLSNIQPEPV